MVNMEASSTPSFWQLSSVGCLITATAGLVRRGSLIHGNALSTSICTARNMQHPCMKTRPRSVAIRSPSDAFRLHWYSTEKSVQELE